MKPNPHPSTQLTVFRKCSLRGIVLAESTGAVRSLSSAGATREAFAIGANGQSPNGRGVPHKAAQLLSVFHSQHSHSIVSRSAHHEFEVGTNGRAKAAGTLDDTIFLVLLCVPKPDAIVPTIAHQSLAVGAKKGDVPRALDRSDYLPCLKVPDSQGSPRPAGQLLAAWAESHGFYSGVWERKKLALTLQIPHFHHSVLTRSAGD